VNEMKRKEKERRQFKLTLPAWIRKDNLCSAPPMDAEAYNIPPVE